MQSSARSAASRAGATSPTPVSPTRIAPRSPVDSSSSSPNARIITGIVKRQVSSPTAAQQSNTKMSNTSSPHKATAGISAQAVSSPSSSSHSSSPVSPIVATQNRVTYAYVTKNTMTTSRNQPGATAAATSAESDARRESNACPLSARQLGTDMNGTDHIANYVRVHPNMSRATTTTTTTTTATNSRSSSPCSTDGEHTEGEDHIDLLDDIDRSPSTMTTPQSQSCDLSIVTSSRSHSPKSRRSDDTESPLSSSPHSSHSMQRLQHHSPQPQQSHHSIVSPSSAKQLQLQLELLQRSTSGSPHSHSSQNHQNHHHAHSMQHPAGSPSQSGNSALAKSPSAVSQSHPCYLFACVPRLNYFATTTRLEMIRVLLEDSQVPYEYDYGNAEHSSLYEEGPKIQLGESNATVIYVAKKLGLYPSDTKQAKRSEMVLEAASNLLCKFFDFTQSNQQTQSSSHQSNGQLPQLTMNGSSNHVSVVVHRPPMTRDKYEHILVQWYSSLQRLLLQNHNGDQFICRQFCFADLVLFMVIEMGQSVARHVLHQFPKLQAYHERILRRPAVSDFVGRA